MAHRKVLSAVLALIVGMLVVGLALFAVRRRIEESREVHYVVPFGYRGVLATRAKRGASPIPLIHGNYIVTFPKSGVLDVASNDVFYSWHNYCPANYDNGTAITEGNPIPDMKPNGVPDVEFFDMGADSDDLCYWFVGTHDEFVATVGKGHRDFLTDAQRAILWPPSSGR